jgi:hypothetical protein
MNQSIKYLIFSCLCLLGEINLLNAQDYEEKLPNYTFSVEPLLLYNGGLRLNFEKQLKPRHWLGINITGYLMPYDSVSEDYYDSSWITSNSDFDSFLELKGLGLSGAYKYHFNSTYFVAAGISYTYFDVGYQDYVYHRYEEDGLTLYDYGLRDMHQYFHKATGSLCFGIHSNFHHAFYVEPYLGLGYAYSLYDKDKKPFNKTIFGFGYKGTYITAGVKLGFNIK